jgi:hypothetical protein
MESLKIFLESRRKKIYSKAPRPALGPTQPRNRWLAGAIYLADHWPIPEVDHSPLWTSGFKNK